MAAHTSNSNCNLIAHDLGANHRQSFALSWVDFSWHDTWSWFIFWKIQLSQSTSWPAAQESDIVCDLEEADGNCVESTMEFNHGIFGSQRFELVWSSDERMSSFFWNCLCNTLSKSNVSVETSTYGGSSLSELWELLDFAFDSSDGHFQLMSVAWKLLA